MDDAVERCLSSPAVRSFLFKRTPEGKFPPDAFSSALSYRYMGGKSAPGVDAPKTIDTYICHARVDGFILGEILWCQVCHPLLPTMMSVATMKSVPALKAVASTGDVSTRRFVLDVNEEGELETVEFCWMKDGRLLLGYCASDISNSLEWMKAGEFKLYAPTAEGDVPKATEFKVVIADGHPVACKFCRWRGIPACECAPAMVSRGKKLLKKQMVVRGSWSNYVMLFNQLGRRGKHSAVYYETRDGVDYKIHQGVATYCLEVAGGLKDIDAFRKQLQLYARAAGNMISSPQTDRSIRYSDYLAAQLPETTDSHSSNTLSQENSPRLAELYHLESPRSSCSSQELIDSPTPKWNGEEVQDSAQAMDYTSNNILISDPDRDIVVTENTFKCGICGLLFQRKANCRRHIVAVHSTNKDHTCTICASSFDDILDLRKHEVDQHQRPPKPYCEICGKKFRLTSSLELHVRTVHNQEKPFECSYCQMSFARKSSMTRHTRSVHMFQKYVCSEPGCNAEYAQPFDLKKHKMRKGHGGFKLSPSGETIPYARSIRKFRGGSRSPGRYSP